MSQILYLSNIFGLTQAAHFDFLYFTMPLIAISGFILTLIATSGFILTLIAISGFIMPLVEISGVLVFVIVIVVYRVCSLDCVDSGLKLPS